MTDTPHPDRLEQQAPVASRARASLVAGGSILLLALVGWISGLLTSLTSALVWLVANSAAGLEYSTSYISVANTGVQLVAFATVAALIAAQRDALIRERARSRNDALTGLLNVRGLHDRAALEIARCRRTRATLTIAVLDLDHFKEVNDMHGHAAGDRVLVDVSEALRQRFRAMDITARLGGDEFVVLMPESTAEGATRALEDVRKAITRTSAERGYAVTASVGACVFGTVGDSLSEMLRQADRVMYDVKSTGRDRVTVIDASALVSPADRPSA